MTSEFIIGVHSLVYLNHMKITISSEELAQNVCTNPARIRKVMAKLKSQGLIETKEGIGGGYVIGKPAEAVSLYDIKIALDEVAVRASWKSGDPNMECLVASGTAGIVDGIYDEINVVYDDYLKGITIDDLDKKIFN